jgi:hypothetical protein
MWRPVLLCLALGSLAGADAAQGQSPRQQTYGSATELRQSLRNYVLGRWGRPEQETRYVAHLTDLNGDGRNEALVYISGREWCGSGGCNLWILTPRSRSWRMVTQTTITWPPIRVLNTKTHGWRDVAVFVAGGGIIPGHEVALRFNGRSYPTNPSMVPATTGRRPSGTMVISRQTDERILFP